MSLAMATTWRPCGHSGVRSVHTQATTPTSFCGGGGWGGAAAARELKQTRVPGGLGNRRCGGSLAAACTSAWLGQSDSRTQQAQNGGPCCWLALAWLAGRVTGLSGTWGWRYEAPAGATSSCTSSSLPAGMEVWRRGGGQAGEAADSAGEACRHTGWMTGGLAPLLACCLPVTGCNRRCRLTGIATHTHTHAVPTWWRHRAGLARRRALRPQLAQRVLKHGREVEAVGGLVAAGGQPLLLQRLQRRVGRQHRLPVAGPALVVCRRRGRGQGRGVSCNRKQAEQARPAYKLPGPILAGGQLANTELWLFLHGRDGLGDAPAQPGQEHGCLPSPPKCLDTYTTRAAAPEAEPGEPALGAPPPGLPPGLPALLSRYTSTHSSPASWPVGAATTTRQAPVLSGTRSRTSHCATAALRSCVEWRAVMAAAAARSADATRVSSRAECSGSADSTDR